MSTLKIQPVELCNNIGKCMASPQSYASAMPRFGYSSAASANPARVAAYALQQLEIARQKDVAAHERNLPAIENNKAVAAQVMELMAAIGMPAKWSERDLKSRSRYPKTISHEAGYLTDLRREVKTSDGFEYATQQYERMAKDYKAYAERAAAEDAQKRQEAERAAAAELEKRKADMELATVLLRYSLPIESTWRDVLEMLCQRHQRLALAVAMQQTRGDWSEGPYRVRNALGAFQIETTEDKDIANDILACLEDFSDGRVFRDTTWSYDALFASITDQQLVADARLALNHSTY